MIRLPHRALLLLRGADTLPLMQGLITNDVRILESGKAMAAYLLNVKGRIVEDLILWRRSEDLLVECSSSTRGSLKKTLEKYRMRKKVEIVETDEPVCYSADSGDISDPRVPSLGFRSFGKDGKDGIKDYDSLRRNLGVAEGSEEVSGLLPFQCNGDLLQMISLNKGCYIGQELTARTAHTGVIRRRILPFSCDASTTALQGPVRDANEKKMGEVISCENGVGIALLSLSAVHSPLLCQDVEIKPFRPPWMPEEIFDKSAGTTQ